MKFTFQLKLALGLALTFGVFIILSLYTYSNNQKQLRASEIVAHTNEVLISTERLFNELLNAETGQRGFLLTNNKEFLAPYLESVDSVSVAFNKLLYQTKDNEEQNIVVKTQLSPLVYRRMKFLETGIALFNIQKDIRPSLKAGKITMDTIREVIYKIQLKEKKLLKERSAINAMQVSNFNYTYAGTTLFLAVILAILFLSIYQNIKARDTAENDLMLALDQVRDIYNNAPCGYHSVNALGVVTDMNDTMLKWIGRTRQEVIGKLKITDILAKFTQTSFQDSFSKFKKEGYANNVELDIIKNDGTILSVIANSTALFDPSGTFIKSRTSTFDNSERKSAEQERDSFFNYTLDLMVVFSSDGRILKWNPQWSTELGYTNEDLLNKSLFELIHPDDLQRTTEVLGEKLGRGERITGFENRYVSKSGVYHWLLWNAVPDLEKKVIYGFARDITKRIETEEKMLHLNQELEAFTYSVSHDLRAPLRSITGYAQILIEDYAEKLDSEAIRLSNVIIISARRMGKLIDDLLDFSRMGRKDLSHEKINMDSLVQEVLRDLILPGDSERIKITRHGLKTSFADRSMLRQVWTNLISNAVKYSSKKERSEIEIGSYEDGRMTCYYVKDNGTGFDMRYVDKLFGVFQRLHKITEFEGTGVGLALVRRIIHRHGGETWGEGKLNEGAKFYFTLPTN